jgi:hypothetical protein
LTFSSVVAHSVVNEGCHWTSVVATCAEA